MVPYHHSSKLQSDALKLGAENRNQSTRSHSYNNSELYRVKEETFYPDNYHGQSNTKTTLLIHFIMSIS